MALVYAPGMTCATCNRPDSQCGICADCDEPHALCIPCGESAAAPTRRPAPGDGCTGCRHTAAIHSVAGPCLLVTVADGRKLLLPPDAKLPSGCKRCECQGFTGAKPKPPPDAEKEDLAGENYEVEDDDEDDLLA